VSVVVLARDLIIGSRIAEAARRSGVPASQVERIDALPTAAAVDLLLVDWSERQPDWAGRLRDWRSSGNADAPPRVLLFGPHTDLEAHRAARASGLGPMMARSKLVASLDPILGELPPLQGSERT